MISYSLTNDCKIPAIVTKDGYSTPVWIQQKWENGEYSKYIQQNGCGHCCTAMALNLSGIKINPYEEFSLCRKLWGEPREEEPYCEGNFISACGITRILNSFDVPAQYFGVPVGKINCVKNHIKESLCAGKLIILWSHPNEKLPNNPFSSGDHYILLIGYEQNGKILVANSSEKTDTNNGIQIADLETIIDSLYEGCEPKDFTWGRYDLVHSGGYVVVG